MDPAQTPIRATTQEHLDIEDIRDDLVILKNGSCCLVLQTTAVNFDLLSETEQDAIIYAYSGLLNSLIFPIQIFIRSQKKDISSYLNLLKQQVDKQTSPKFKQMIKNYQQFVEKTVKDNDVLDKNFYIIIPFSSLELGISQTIKYGITGGKAQTNLPKEYILEKAKTNLYPKRDHIIKQFARLGLKTTQLTSKELIELFFIIYSPESVGQKLTPPEEYDTYLVQPAVEQNPSLATKTSQTETPPSSQPKQPGEKQKLNQEIEAMINKVQQKNNVSS